MGWKKRIKWGEKKEVKIQRGMINEQRIDGRVEMKIKKRI